MSAIHVFPETARVHLNCCRWEAGWVSEIYRPGHYGDAERACIPAFDAGWRIFSSGHGQRAYCPDCEPTTNMWLVFSKVKRPEL
jgi:hypothetical protein